MPLAGTFTRSLDEKRRLAIPKRLLEEFGHMPDLAAAESVKPPQKLTRLYVSPGMDKCLALYSPMEFEVLAQKIAQQSPNRADVRNYVRLLYSRTEEVDLDSQSRIRISDRLVELAGLKGDVVLVGVRDHAELWNPEAWEAYLKQHTPGFDDLATLALT